MFRTLKHKGEALRVKFDEAALGVWGEPGERTCVRRTDDGRFVVITCEAETRVIKVFTDALHARRYNAAIHGGSLGE